jgi:hypothetical protein
MPTLIVDRPGGIQTIEDASKIPTNRAVMSLNSLSRSAMARQVGGFTKWNDTEFDTAGAITALQEAIFADGVSIASHLLANRNTKLYAVPATGASTAIHTWAAAGLEARFAWFDVYTLIAVPSSAGNADTIQVWNGTVSASSTTDLIGGLLSAFPAVGVAASPLQDIRPKLIVTTGKGPAAGTVSGGAASPDQYLFALDYIDMHGGGAGVKTYHRNNVAFVNLTQGLATPPTIWDYSVVGGGVEGDRNYCVAIAIFGPHLFIWRAFGDLYVFKYVVDPEFFGNAAAGYVPEHVPFFEAANPGLSRGIIKTPGPLFFPMLSGVWGIVDPSQPKPVKASRGIEGEGGVWASVKKTVDIAGTYDPVRRLALWAVALGAHVAPSHWLVMELPDDDAQLQDFSKYEWHLWDRRGSTLAYSVANGNVVWGSPIHGFLYIENDELLSAVDIATVSGTVTASAATTIDDSAAAFTAACVGRPVVIAKDVNDYLDVGWVASQTATQLTFAETFDPLPPVGATYEVGGMRWRWTSKKFKQDVGLKFFTTMIAQMQATGSVTLATSVFRDNSPDPLYFSQGAIGGVSLLDFILGTSSLSDGTSGNAFDVEIHIDVDADRIQFALSSYGSERRIALVTAMIEWNAESVELTGR